MRQLMNLVIAVVMCAGAGRLALGQTPATQPAQDPDAPPPQAMELEVDGRRIPVRPDEPFEIDVDGRKLTMRLRTQPYRVFDRGDVLFHYPAGHAWEVDRSDPAATLWTMDGNSNVIMLVKYNVPVALDAAAEGFLEGMLEHLGGRDVDAQRSSASIMLGGRAIDGTRLDVDVAGTVVRQDLYAFEHNGSTYVLIIQDTPDGPGPTEETRRTIQMLERTFRFQGD